MNIKDIKFSKRKIPAMFFLFIVALILITCEDEKPVSREYPRLSETSVSNICDTGAYFSANLYSMGDETILLSGFIWSDNANADPINSEIVYLQAPQQTGIFSTSVTSSLRYKVQYYVRSFVKTNKRTVFGPRTSFVSSGSIGPQIDGFTPDAAGWGDIILITGKNFSYISNKVFLNNISCPVIEASDTTIKAVIPTEIVTNSNTVSVEVSGMKRTFLDKNLVLIPPSITDFYPKQAHLGEVITIKGKYLKTVSAGNNYINLGNTKCQATYFSDTIVRIIVDYKLNTIDNPLKISINGLTLNGPGSMQLLFPEIREVFPVNVYWGDTITLKGKYLAPLTMNQNFISLGDVKCPIIHSKDTIIKFIVDPNVNSISNALKMNLNGLTATNPTSITLLKPSFTFTPAEGTWNTTVTLKGRFNTVLSKNDVFFNTTRATIKSVTATSMKVSVPVGLQDSTSVIKLNVSPFSIFSENNFRLLPPVIKSFSPLSGAGGTLVTIYGKNFTTIANQNIVRFGDTQATVVIKNDSTLTATVPNSISGPFKISVTVYSQKKVSTSDFLVTNPVITSISPLAGTFNNEITINGTGFSPSGTTVSFGTLQSQIVSVNETRIVAKVPLTLDSIPAAIKVTVNNNYALSSEKFTLDAHSVSSATGAYSPGGELRITGSNFNPVPSGNIVSWNDIQLKTKSATPTEIIAEWGNMPKGTYKIQVQTGGYKRYCNESFSINSAWTKIPSPKLLTNYSNGYYDGIRNYGAGIQNFGYVFSAAMNETYRFNPADQSWTKVASGPLYSNPICGSASLVFNNKLVIVGGVYYGSSIAEFNPTNNTWQKYANSYTDMISGISFGLNNRLWFGLNRNSTYQAFSEFNPDNNYSYIRSANFPVPVPANIASYFTIAGKGYVVFANNQVWQFDPSNTSWLRKNDFPGSQRKYASSFIISDYAYFGLGYASGNQNFDDIWKYDPLADTWSLKTRIPVGRFSATVFTINNKAYIGFGAVNNGIYPNDIFDFYEFDPSF